MIHECIPNSDGVSGRVTGRFTKAKASSYDAERAAHVESSADAERAAGRRRFRWRRW